MTANEYSNQFDLSGRTILVTGAAGYLGEAISIGIADMGGVPILSGRTENKLRSLSERIKASGREAHVLQLDISSIDSCKKAIRSITDNVGVLHGIVNCAHSGRPGTVFSAEQDDFDIAMKVHVSGPFFLIREALPLLRVASTSTNEFSSIVNVSSMYGSVSPDPRIYGDSGSNNPPYYGAAKAAMIQLTKYLACHLSSEHVRANSVSPGAFPPESIQYNNPEFYKALCGKNPLNRIGKQNEVVGAVIFLLSSASSYITGQNIAVDGGWTSW